MIMLYKSEKETKLDYNFKMLNLVSQVVFNVLSRFHLTPLSYETLEYASGFSSEQCPEGVVAISGNTLRILAMEKLGAVFNQMSFPLQFTPKKFAIHPGTGHLIIIETDHNAYTDEVKRTRRVQMAEVNKIFRPVVHTFSLFALLFHFLV